MGWLVLALAAATFVESTVLTMALPPGISPEITLVLVLLWSILRGWEQGLVVGLLGGLLQTFVSAAPPAVVLLRLGGAGALAGLVARRLGPPGPLLPPAIVAAGTFIAFALGAIGLQATGWAVAWSGLTLGQLLVRASLNAGLGFVALRAVRLVAGPSTRPAEAGL